MQPGILSAAYVAPFRAGAPAARLLRHLSEGYNEVLLTALRRHAQRGTHHAGKNWLN